MAISSNNFVNVSSTIITETALPRDFSGLVISNGSPKGTDIGVKYAAGEVVSVTVNTYANLFDETSPEFEWALNYFSYVSNSGTIPSKLKFMKRKDATASATAYVTGTGTSGATVTASTFSTAVSGKSGVYTFVCTTGGSNAVWKLNGTTAQLDTYGIAPTGTAATNDKIIVGFLAAGTSAETAKEAFVRAKESSETFGSFTFLSGAATGIATASELKIAAKYNEGLNCQYRMVVDYSINASTDDNYYTKYVTKGDTTSDSMWGIKGLTLCNNCSFLTMARLAATDYTGTNTTSCDMFKSIGGVSATVTEDTVYDTLTDLRLNFIGLVKEHGNQWNWYMRGFNMDDTDTACYDNEMWFKSEIVKDLLQLEDSMEKIPANDQGLSFVRMTILDSVSMALANGTILPGKPISKEKQNQLIAMTGSSDVLDLLNRQGYAVYTWMTSEGENYIINYRIIYLKGDSVREINGTHVIA